MTDKLTLTAKQAKMLNSIKAELDAGKKVIRRPIEVCKVLDHLAGQPKDKLGAWDLMRPEFKTAYPLEAHNVKAALQRIRSRIKGE